MIRSNYVVAGFETVASIIDNFMLGKKENWNNNFQRKDISDFFKNTIAGCLHSFGQDIKTVKNYERHLYNEVNLFKICRDMEFFENTEFIADSGGFQIATANLSVEASNKMIEMYYRFLRDHHQVIDKGFILDIPPGPSCQVFKTFKQVYEKNLESYLIAKNLPDESRNKVIYVHHFRTPKLWDIYTRILREENMYEYFQHFGTGGVVANMRSDISIPCIIYILPLIPLINETIKHKRSKLNFHVLGGSGYRDVLFYEFFKLHVYKKHKIELNITYDSSGLFKGLLMARVMAVIDNENVRKITVKSDNLERRFDNNRRVIDLLNESFQVMYHRHKKLKKINLTLDNIYNPETNTFYEDIKIYLMLYQLDAFSRIQGYLRNFVEEVYPFYESGDLYKFSDEIAKQTKNLNYGKITRKQTAKSNIIIKSLDMLTSLDESQCKHMVEKYLGQDEFTELTNQRILKF